MTDPDLLSFGCIISFIAVAGAWMFVRDYGAQREQRLARIRTRRTDHDRAA